MSRSNILLAGIPEKQKRGNEEGKAIKKEQKSPRTRDDQYYTKLIEYPRC